MKKNECYEGEVISLKFPNKAVVEVEGEETKTIVKNALPGQRVFFCCKKLRKGKPEGMLLDVLRPSEMENQKPPCPHFSECGGCSYQTMDYENQKQLKLSQVQKLLTDVCPDYPLDTCLSSPAPWEYRNKMEFSFGDEVKDGPLSLGLHKQGSFYDILPVPECQIVDEDVRMILRATLEFFQEKNLPFYHKMSHEGVLRHLLVRKARKTGEILAALVTTSQQDVPAVEYCEMLRKLPIRGTYAGILHMINDSLSDVVKSECTELLYGKDYFYEEILGLRFKISPFSFFQTNSAGAEVLYQTAREYIGDIEGKVVFDLYSGTGTIAQVLAPVAKKVVGVEIVEEAVRAAKENARRNNLDNCTFIAGDVLKVLDSLEEIPDTIVLDPPREGIHPKALQKILNYGVQRILYISCKPTSLARDLEAFLENGYRPVKSVCVDMFPWTRGIETVVLLSKGMVDSRKVKIDFSLEDMDLSEFKGKATYEQIKAYVLEQTGLKVSSLYIAQIKKKCGLDVGENFNLPKSENAKQPKCTPEKEEAITQAFRHFGII